MKQKIQSLLLPFYFGSINSEQRTVVERELLVDTEFLIDYLDLKREIEFAEPIPNGPSVALWSSLQRKMQMQTSRKYVWTFGIGIAAVAAALIFVFIFRPTAEIESYPRTTGLKILFDANSELPASSNVL
jgi:hypothetical protein